jgi:hypothetical protein
MLVVTQSANAIAATFTGLYNIPFVPAPVPLPNISKMDDLKEGSFCDTVQIANKPVAVMNGCTSRSMGDDAPKAAGVVSGKQQSGAEATRGSQSVFARGKPVLHIGSPMMMNERNMVGTFLAPSQFTVTVAK